IAAVEQRALYHASIIEQANGAAVRKVLDDQPHDALECRVQIQRRGKDGRCVGEEATRELRTFARADIADVAGDAFGSGERVDFEPPARKRRLNLESRWRAPLLHPLELSLEGRVAQRRQCFPRHSTEERLGIDANPAQLLTS